MSTQTAIDCVQKNGKVDIAKLRADTVRRAEVRRIGGFIASGVWLLFAVALIFLSDKPLPEYGLNEIGDFLAGVCAPLAFLWLVIGYFQQSDELRLSTDVLAQQVHELEESVSHQSVLAKYAEETHKADMDDRRRRNEIDKKRAQPDLRIKSAHIGESRHQPKIYLFLFTINTGAECRNVEMLLLDGDNAGRISPNKLLKFVTDKDQKFQIPLHHVGIGDTGSWRLVMSYTDKLEERTRLAIDITVSGRNELKLNSRHFDFSPDYPDWAR